jgi:hypothetical protein
LIIFPLSLPHNHSKNLTDFIHRTPWLTTRRRTCPICKGDVVRSLASSSSPQSSSSFSAAALPHRRRRPSSPPTSSSPANPQHSSSTRPRNNSGHDRVVETELEERQAFVLQGHNHRDEDLNPVASSAAQPRRAVPSRSTTDPRPVILSRDFEAQEDLERGTAAVLEVESRRSSNSGHGGSSQRRRSR